MESQKLCQPIKNFWCANGALLYTSARVHYSDAAMTTMSRPASVNFRLYPHATFVANTVLLDANQQPVDLTGYSARMQIKRDRSDLAPIYTLTTEPNGGIVLGSDGAIDITLSAGQTAPVLVPAIDPNGEVWFHDLLLTSPDGSLVERLYQGTVSVFPGVTVPA